MNRYKSWLYYWLIVLILFLCTGELGAMIIGSGTIIDLLDLLIVLFMIVAPMMGISIWIGMKRSAFLKGSLLNVVVTVACAFIAFYTPTRGLVNLVRGQPKIVAYYEGTQNQALLTLRQNNSFDIWWTGVFGYDEYFRGDYRQEADSLIFHFSGEPPRKFNGQGRLVRKENRIALVRFFRSDPEDTVYTEHDFEVTRVLPAE